MTNHDIFYFQQELEDPLIIIHEKKISSINSIVKVLELALKVSSAIRIILNCIVKYWYYINLQFLINRNKDLYWLSLRMWKVMHSQLLF
jgi:hypothetical protein